MLKVKSRKITEKQPKLTPVKKPSTEYILVIVKSSGEKRSLKYLC